MSWLNFQKVSHYSLSFLDAEDIHKTITKCGKLIASLWGLDFCTAKTDTLKMSHVFYLKNVIQISKNNNNNNANKIII